MAEDDNYNSIYDKQLSVTWALRMSYDDIVDLGYVGGALCFNRNGYLVTAFHIFDKVKDMKTLEIRGKNYSNMYDKKISRLFDFPTLDISILKVDEKANFDYMDIPSQFEIEIGERLACHGHASKVLFSSWFGKTSYAYKSPTNLSTLLGDLDQTIGDLNPKFVTKKRKNFPTPQFRTAVGCFCDPPDQESQSSTSSQSQEDQESQSSTSSQPHEELDCRHPYLPLIEIGTRTLGGYSGCPLFRTDGVDGINNFGEVVGMLICEVETNSYLVPSDVLHYVIHDLLDGELNL